MKPHTAHALTVMTREGYERIADQFDRTRRKHWNDFTVFDSSVKEGDSVLDIGCGNGRLFSYLAHKSIAYVGIDASRSLIARAETAYHAHPLEPRFIVGDILSLDHIQELRGKKFHAIFMVASFHHIPRRRQALAALKRARQFLLPNGLLCMENWNLWRLEKGPKTAWSGLSRRLSFALLPWEKEYGISHFDLGINDIITEWKSEGVKGHLYYHAYTVRALRSLLHEAGYTIKQSYYIRDGVRARWWNGKNIMTIAQPLNSRHR